MTIGKFLLLGFVILTLASFPVLIILGIIYYKKLINKFLNLSKNKKWLLITLALIYLSIVIYILYALYMIATIPFELID